MPTRKTEIIAGLTTFFTMAYIVVVNPAILSTPGTGMPFSGVLTATVLLCFSMTLLMGLYAKLPFAVAPGMGINAFFTYSIILGQKVPWPAALGMVFWSGVLFLLISVTPVREKIARSVPPHLRAASSAGIGIFLSFIGLKNAGFIAADPVTFVKIGPMDARAWLGVTGMAVTALLLRKKNPFAFLAGIATVTLGASLSGNVPLPETFFSVPDFDSVLFKLDFTGGLKLALLPAIVSMFFTDLFDSISTFIGVSHANQLLDSRGEPKNLREGLIVDAFATTTAGIFGTSAGTAYIESSAGIEVGGRTGFTSVVTAIAFLPCLFLAPLIGMVPGYATAPVLILIGALMFKTVREVKLDALEDTIPSFLTLILIPLTFSITEGMLWGFLSHTLLYFLTGRRRELSPWMIGIGVLSGVLLALQKTVS